jgi:PmbA protein
LEAIVDGLAGVARAGEQVEAYAVRSRDTSIRAYEGEVEQLSTSEIDGVGVRVITAGRQGYAWAGSLDADVISETLDEARDNASFGAPDEFNVLPEPGEFAGIPVVSLDVWRDALVSMPVDEKVRIALDLEARTRTADPRITGVESADWHDAIIESAIASSTGVRGATRRTSCSVSVYALVADGDATLTGLGFDGGRQQSDLDLDATVQMAVDRSTRLIGAKQARSRRIPVIVDPMMSRALLGLFSAALSGEALTKGRSMFADRAGDAVGAESVTIVEDPTNAESLAASQYDAEGVTTRRTELVASGVLRGFLHNTYTGRRSGAGTTGSAMRAGFKSAPGVGCRGLSFEPGTQSPEAIRRGAGEAFYVQSMQGLHSGANPVSGDFSVGAEGLMVRNGEFAEPVREVTIASTLQRILHDIAAIGNDLTWYPGSMAGVTLLISDMTLSGS